MDLQTTRKKRMMVFFRQKPVKRHCWRCWIHSLQSIFFIILFFIGYCNYGVQSNKSSKSIFSIPKLPSKHRSTTLTRYHLTGLNSYLPRWHKSFKASKPIWTFSAFQMSWIINETHLRSAVVDETEREKKLWAVITIHAQTASSFSYLALKMKAKKFPPLYLTYSCLYNTFQLQRLGRCIVHESSSWKWLLFCVWISCFSSFFQLTLHIISLIVSVPCVLYALDVHFMFCCWRC